jgi:hypothetical protein
MKTLEVEIVGIAPLLMHSARMADPMDPSVKEYKKVSQKRSKTDDDYEWLSKNEWLLGIHSDVNGNVVIPDLALEAVLAAGATNAKKGKLFKGAVIVPESAKLFNPETKQYYTVENCRNKAEYYDIRIVVVEKRRIPRTRPIFNKWACKFTVLFDETIVNASDVQEATRIAGATKGLLDYRPKYGKFQVVSFKEI